jgi:antitoxin component of RelBE/YafQ-DinJ toxin-antitoxin module
MIEKSFNSTSAIEIDDELWRAADKHAKSIGMTLSEMIEKYLRYVLKYNENRKVFPLEKIVGSLSDMNYDPNKTNKELLSEAKYEYLKEKYDL